MNTAATQRAQDASFDKHGADHYSRMIEAYAFAVRLEMLLRRARILTSPGTRLREEIDAVLDAPKVPT